MGIDLIEGHEAMGTRAAVWVNEFLDHVVARSFQRDAEVQRRAKRVAAFAAAFVFWILVFGWLMAAFGAPNSAMIVFVTGIPILGSVALTRWGFSPTLAGNVICASGWLALTLLALLNGGATAAVLLWYSTLPVVAVLTAGPTWGVLWTVVPAGSLAVLAVSPNLVLANEIPPENRLPFAFCVLAGLIVCQYILAWVRVGVEQRALAALHETNAKLERARETLATLEAGFGFSMEAWARLQREKAALERYVRLQFGDEAAKVCRVEEEVPSAS